MPASVPAPRLRIGSMKGWNVFTMPSTFTSRISAKVRMSAASSVSVPCEMPALATTRSGTPWRAMKSRAAASTAGRSRTSQA